MKGKELKQWVLSKRRSLTDSRRSAGQQPGLTPAPAPALAPAPASAPTQMQVDTPDAQAPSAATSLPRKTVFYAKGTPFRVDPRYSYHKTLGLGAYGVVCAANDSILSRRVALKKVTGVFDDLTDAKRIIREIRLLSSMKHENILTILDIDEPDCYDAFNDVYIVTELMDTDMHKLLRSKHPLEDAQRKYFAYQICRALKYIHRYVC